MGERVHVWKGGWVGGWVGRQAADGQACSLTSLKRAPGTTKGLGTASRV